MSAQVENSGAPRPGGIVLMAFSSAASLLLSLARTKLVALFLGPAGIGLLGLVQSTMATATLIGGAGLDSIVTREAAKARASGEGLEISIAVGLRGSMLLGFATALVAVPVLAVFGEQLGTPGLISLMAVAAAIASSIVGTNYRALLAGISTVTDSALASLASAVGALVLTAALVMLSVPLGVVVAFVALAIPASQVVATGLFVWRHTTETTVTWRELLVPLRTYLGEAGGFAIAGVVPVLTQLIARSVVRGCSDNDRFGYFQASLALGTTVTSVLAASVGASVLPSLSRVSASEERLRAAADQSARTYLVLVAPLVLLIAVFPADIVRLLYSSRFEPVSEQLSWQLMGEVVRLPAWVLSSVLLVLGRARAYLIVELTSGACMLVCLWFAVGLSGLASLGLAVAVGAVTQFVMCCFMAVREGVWLSLKTWSVMTGLVVWLGCSAAFSWIPWVRWAGGCFLIASCAIALRLVALERLKKLLRSVT